METINLETTRDEAFLREVEAESGQKVTNCYQCGNCTAGCPCGPEYDLQVSQVMRAVQLGNKEMALSSRSLWLCVSCSTCTSRCPNNIDVAKVMDVLRHMAWKEGKTNYAMASFWQSFLTTVRHFGRTYELGVMAMFMARTGRVFTDVDLAPRILPKQKLPFKPHTIVGKDAVARIFKRFDEQRSAEGDKEMKLAYYPGCSGQGTSAEYERSTRAVCRALEIGLKEISDWSCCGSTPAHACDHVLSSALSARNLALAAAEGAERVGTPCPSCLANLKTAKYRMQDEAFRDKVNALLDNPCPEELPETVSILQVLVEDYGTGAIAEKVKKPLEGIKVACYYGCLMSRPADIMQFDDAENPMAMDNIMTALGAEVVPFPLKTECCGAAMGIPRRDITARLTGRILERAQAFGADAVVVACPLCHMNLDLRQRQAVGGSMKMPVLYFTQLMGLALGLPHQELGFEKLCVSPDELLRKIDAAQAAKAAAAKADEATEEAKA